MSHNNTKNKKGLGRGFDALMPTDIDAIIGKQNDDRIQNLLISDIIPNPDQPRKSFDEQKLNELADSIKQYGVLQPVIVTKHDGVNKYIIIAGERRWRSANIAGLDRLPAVVRTLAELEQLEVSIVENIQREDLSPLEQAASISKLHEVFGVSYESIAKRLNKAETTVHNIVRLMQLPDEAKEALAKKDITEGHARAILALKGLPDHQKHLLELIYSKGWSVRQAEQFVVATKSDSKDTNKAKERASSTNGQTKRLTKILDYPVSVSHMAKGGRLLIRFKSDDEFNKLIELLETVKK